MDRMYHLVTKMEHSSRQVQLTRKAMTHREACTMKRRLSQPAKILLVESNGSDDYDQNDGTYVYGA